MNTSINISISGCQNCPNFKPRKKKKKDKLDYLFSNKPPTDLIPVDEMERLVHITRRTLYDWSNRGTFIPLVKHGRTIMGWRRDDYERWAAKKS